MFGFFYKSILKVSKNLFLLHLHLHVPKNLYFLFIDACQASSSSLIFFLDACQAFSSSLIFFFSKFLITSNWILIGFFCKVLFVSFRLLKPFPDKVVVKVTFCRFVFTDIFSKIQNSCSRLRSPISKHIWKLVKVELNIVGGISSSICL